jgi:hypothetical protein
MKHSFEFYTSHHQFYICDKNTPGGTDSDEFWTQEACNDRLAIEDRILGVETASYGPIIGEIHIQEKENKTNNFSKYDHVVEAGLNLESGILQIRDCPNLAVEFEIQVKPDHYKVRIYSSDLNIEDEEVGGDFYKIEIWSDKISDKKVLKKYLAD